MTAIRTLVKSIKSLSGGNIPFIGHVDDPCSQFHIAIGWVTKRGDGKPEVDVYVNGQCKISITAEIDRPDLIRAGLENAKGFAVPLSSFLLPGENKIDIRFSGTKTSLPNGKKTIRAKPTFDGNTYEDLYETHARQNQEESVGCGDYYAFGKTEFELLRMEGLKPTDTLVDFGCGNGRLAVHVIPYLKQGGTYIGIDIAETYLEHAARRVSREVGNYSCDVRWVHQTSPAFSIAENSVNMICAFSVFTHMEHEDTLNYLKAALKIMKPKGKFIYSCLPIHLKSSQFVFNEEAKLSLDARWQKIRSVVTSVDLMNGISKLAGWNVLNWYEGDQPNIALPNGEWRELGQSSCVLEA